MSQLLDVGFDTTAEKRLSRALSINKNKDRLWPVGVQRSQFTSRGDDVAIIKVEGKKIHDGVWLVNPVWLVNTKAEDDVKGFVV